MKFLRITYFILETIILLPIKLLAIIWWLICGGVYLACGGTWREYWTETIINNVLIIKSMNWIKTGKYETIES